MRIIAGKFKGRKLNPPEMKQVRPTTDFARESLFNILQGKVFLHETNALDLYGGFGGISFELISRGASRVTYVDRNKKAVKFTAETAEILGLSDDKLKIIKADVLKVLKTLSSTFDLIFMDPPWKSNDYYKALTIIKERKLLNPGGMIILEHSKRFDPPFNEDIIDRRSYGNTSFSFYKQAG